MFIMLNSVILAIIPQIPLVIIIAAILLGEIWNTQIHECTNRDTTCHRSPFDAFTMKEVNNLIYNSLIFIPLGGNY